MRFLTWISGGSGEQERGDALDAQLAEMNARDYGPGGKFYSPQVWKTVQDNLDSGATGDVDAQINDAFKEGLDDGAKNVTGFFAPIFDIVGKGALALLKAVPWWIWLGVLLYVAFQIGLLKKLVGKYA